MGLVLSRIDDFIYLHKLVGVFDQSHECLLAIYIAEEHFFIEQAVSLDFVVPEKHDFVNIMLTE